MVEYEEADGEDEEEQDDEGHTSYGHGCHKLPVVPDTHLLRASICRWERVNNGNIRQERVLKLKCQEGEG